jgi:hypothetical protein
MHLEAQRYVVKAAQGFEQQVALYGAEPALGGNHLVGYGTQSLHAFGQFFDSVSHYAKMVYYPYNKDLTPQRRCTVQVVKLQQKPLRAAARRKKLSNAAVDNRAPPPLPYRPSTDPVRHFFSSSSVVFQCCTEELLKKYR